MCVRPRSRPSSQQSRCAPCRAPQAARSAASAQDRPWSTDGAAATSARGARSSFSGAVGPARRSRRSPAAGEGEHGARRQARARQRRPATSWPGQIADVAVHKDSAYLMSWSPWDNPGDAACRRGGFFSVDIRNPAAPVQMAFVPALPETYHGEGAHAISLTPRVHGRRARRQQRDLRDQRRRRLRPLRRHQPGEPGDAGPGRRRPVPGRRDRAPGPGRGPEVLPQRLHLAGRPARVRGHGSTTPSCTTSTSSTSPTRGPGVHRRPRPRRAVPADRRRTRRDGNAIFHHDMVVKAVGGRMRCSCPTGTPAT